MLGLAQGEARFRLWALLPAALLAVGTAFTAPAASAGPGYQLNSAKPWIPLGAGGPIGVAVDQVSQNIYVAELSADLFNQQPGQIEQFDSTATPTANSPFSKPGETFFTAVAVNPVTQGIYAYQLEGSGPSGVIGSSQMNIFSSTGVLQSTFSPAKSEAGSLATDPSGRVYYPNSNAATVQVFDSAGALKDTISCTGCSGGAFVKPGSVALDSAGNLYVVDQGGGGRVVKFSPSGGTFAYHSVLQSGGGPVAVAVDPNNGDLLVGAADSGEYHVVAYTSSGVPFDDFGEGTSTTSSALPGAFGQLAVNGTTHGAYLTDPGGQKLWLFNRVASIPVPVAVATAASSLSQVAATLKGTVDPEGHTLTDCHFEYTDAADFGANGFANAVSKACPAVVGNSNSNPVSAQVSGLTPGTDYRYRILASSYGGGAESGTQAFETLPPLPPVVASDSASAIAMTSALLRGTVNAKGGPITDCHFEYTDAADFGANGFANAVSKACSITPSGNSDVSVSGAVNGLAVATDYRFRVVATNNSGTAKASEKAFTTLAETCSTNPALCPPPPPEETLPPPVFQFPPSPPVTTPARKPLRCRKGFRKKRVRGKVKCVRIKRQVRRKQRQA